MPRKPKRIGTIDCETDPFKYKRPPVPFCWGFFDGDNYQEFWGDDCTQQLMEYLEDESKIILYAHNGGKFDFFYLLKWLDPDIFIINGRIARATLFGGRIELRDSWLILPLPLAAYQKTAIDYNKFERKHREKHRREILNYLRDDCFFLYDWVTRFISEFGRGLTLAGAAFKQLKETGYQLERTYDQYDERFRDFYFGGRVQCFSTGAHYGDFIYIDINSAYSFAMRHRHWQGGSYVERDKIPDGENGSFFVHCRAVSRGCFPYRGDDDRLYFPDDNIARDYFITGWEYFAAIETGTATIEKIHVVYTPVLLEDFTEYVNKFFKLKAEAKANGDKTLYQFAKLMLNSCYGKFGQDGRKFEKFEICDFGDVPEGEGWTPYCNLDTGQRIYSKADPQDLFYNVATAASVTGFVRAYLWRAICASEGVMYCDTDSIICRKTHVEIDANKLGAWDIEAEPVEVYIAQRKMYALKMKDGTTKKACKGVDLTYDEIRDGVLTGTNITQYREAPAFSLKYGARFFSRETDFENIAKNALTIPPEKRDNKKRSNPQCS